MSYHVLYTRQVEPITVIDLHPRWEKMLRNKDRVRLMVPAYLVFDVTNLPLDDPRANVQTVDLYAEHLVYRGHSHMMIFVDDEEAALALRSEFLPGQRRELQDRQRKAFARGFMTALLGGQP